MVGSDLLVIKMIVLSNRTVSSIINQTEGCVCCIYNDFGCQDRNGRMAFCPII